MATEDDLARLVDIQEHDSALDQLEERRRSLPARSELADEESRFLESREKLEHISEKLERFRKRQREGE